MRRDEGEVLYVYDKLNSDLIWVSKINNYMYALAKVITLV